MKANVVTAKNTKLKKIVYRNKLQIARTASNSSVICWTEFAAATAKSLKAEMVIVASFGISLHCSTYKKTLGEHFESYTAQLTRKHLESTSRATLHNSQENTWRGLRELHCTTYKETLGEHFESYTAWLTRKYLESTCMTHSRLYCTIHTSLTNTTFPNTYHCHTNYAKKQTVRSKKTYTHIPSLFEHRNVLEIAVDLLQGLPSIFFWPQEIHWYLICV